MKNIKLYILILLLVVSTTVMAAQVDVGTISYPSVSNVTPNVTTMGASVIGYAALSKMPKTCDINYVTIGIQSVTSAQTISLRIETPDLSATPALPWTSSTGTLYSTATETSFTPAVGLNYVSLGTGTVSATAGDNYVVKLLWSGTTGTIGVHNFADAGIYHPYSATLSAATSTWAATTRQASIGFICGTTPVKQPYGLVVYTPASGAAPNVVSGEMKAIRFKLDFPAWLVGVRHLVDTDYYVGYNLYTDNGVDPTASTLVSGGLGTFTNQVRNANNDFYMTTLFTTTVSLSKNTWYKLASVPAGTVASYDYFTTDFTGPSGTIYGLDFLDGGVNIHMQNYTGSAWSAPTTTKRPGMQLILNGISDGTGGTATNAYQFAY